MEISGIPGTYVNIIKAIYSKPVANTKLNGEKLEAAPLSPYLFNVALQFYLFYVVLARVIRQLKEIKGIQSGK